MSRAPLRKRGRNFVLMAIDTQVTCYLKQLYDNGRVSDRWVESDYDMGFLSRQ